jgi:hypothetical protein
VNIPIPKKTLDAVLSQHMILLGKTGSGKSSAMRLFIEHLLDEGEPVCIVDPKGDHWGLKSSASGKRAGYPIVIFGGEHADVPLNSRSGVAVAELAATGNRPCIIDLGGWMPGARAEFWIDFASSFFRNARGRRWLAIDEVHNFCAKGKIMDPQAGKVLHWSNRLASEGRGKGINLIAASQRPQKVHNDFLTSCETLIAMRVIHKADRDAIKDWIDGAGDMEKGKEVLTSLALMKRGEAWVWSPEAEFGPKQIKFPMFSTYDSFKPQNAIGPVKLKGWADVDLAEVTKKLEAAVKEAEAKDPTKLQAKIRELEKQLTVKSMKSEGFLPSRGKPQIIVDKKAIERAVSETGKVFEKRIALLHGAVGSLQRYLFKTSTEMRELSNHKIAGITLPLAMPDIGKFIPKITSRPAQIAPSHQGSRSTPMAVLGPGTPRAEFLAKGERSTLIAIGRYEEGVERNQLTVLTGYRRSTRDAYLSRLKEKGLWEDRHGRILVTDAGIAALGDAYTPQPATGEALRAYWMHKLPSGEKKLLEALIAAAGEPVDRETLGEGTGFARSSRDAYLSRLGAKRLVESIGRGQVKASASLFA